MTVSRNGKEEPGSLFEEVKRRLAQKDREVSNNSVVPEGLVETIDSLITEWNVTNEDKVNSEKESPRWEKDQK